jgi:plasmid stabilization system protein ParE
MSTNVAKANLIDAMKQLRMRWSHIKYTWQDDAAAKFEREVIDVLEPAILQAARAVEHASELMQQVRRECGDD